MEIRSEPEYLHDWKGETVYPTDVELQDETLRDGLQAPYVPQITLEQRQTMLHIMEELGIEGADIGFPGSGEKRLLEVIGLARYKQENGLSIKLSCAGRTVENDVTAIIRAAEVAGEPIEADLFIGSSDIRKISQDWELEGMKKSVEKSVTLAVAHGLPVMFVTEDTTRATEETLMALYEVAIDVGATRICIADTNGAVDQVQTRLLVRFVRERIIRGRDIKLDWHGHRDTGFDMANSLEAALAGVDRVHGTALGVGERSGNTKMEQLVVNFHNRGLKTSNLGYLLEYAHYASKVLQMPIPVNEPIIGAESFSTASGVHADAIQKARMKGRPDLAALVYSPFDPGLIGRKEEIRVGPLSGKSNVELVLQDLNIEYDGVMVQVILDLAKASNNILSQDEILSAAKRIRRT